MLLWLYVHDPLCRETVVSFELADDGALLAPSLVCEVPLKRKRPCPLLEPTVDLFHTVASSKKGAVCFIGRL